jgi:hypothetical protein
MDWTLTGALGGVAILAGVVGYGSFALISSESGTAKQSSSSVALIPAREHLALAQESAGSNSIAPGSTSATLTPLNSNAPPSYGVASIDSPVPAKAWQSRVSKPMGSRLNGYARPLDDADAGGGLPIDGYSNPPFRQNQNVRNDEPLLYDDSAPAEHHPANLAARYSPVVPHDDTTSVSDQHMPALHPLFQQSDYQWRVVTTGKASYFNLGGHVDKDGVVDSLASSYLRNALKKHKNYPKLPPQIKADIDEPNINLAKIAGYRALLGVDDRKMEMEQGVRFIKVASNRGLDLSIQAANRDSDAADSHIPSLDMNALNKMYFDIVSTSVVAFIP